MLPPKRIRKLFTIVLAYLLLVPFLLGCPGPEGNVAKKLKKEPEFPLISTRPRRRRRCPIEEYLMGVVAGEMKPDWPVEAYAAQAIVARTFTMDFIAEGGTREQHNTDISTDEEEAQAYNADAITRRSGVLSK